MELSLVSTFISRVLSDLYDCAYIEVKTILELHNLYFQGFVDLIATYKKFGTRPDTYIVQKEKYFLQEKDLFSTGH